MTNITTLRPGEHFMFKGFEWICLDPNHTDGGVLAIMALYMTLFLSLLATSIASTVSSSRITAVGCGLPHRGIAVAVIPTRTTRSTFAV